MIRASLVRFINASEIATNLGIKAFVMTPDVLLSEVPRPMALVSYLTAGQELWVLGDAQRKETPILTVAFYLRSAQEVRDVRARFQRLIESAMATDFGGLTHPGIDYVPTADLLRNSGDNLTYFSDQPNWFASPTPIIYKEDANGNPIVVASGYTVNSSAGSVTFGIAQSPTDKIRATYKVGLVDFNIEAINEPQLVDQENNASKYNVVFDLAAWFLIKTNANRYL